MRGSRGVTASRGSGIERVGMPRPGETPRNRGEREFEYPADVSRGMLGEHAPSVGGVARIWLRARGGHREYCRW